MDAQMDEFGVRHREFQNDSSWQGCQSEADGSSEKGVAQCGPAARSVTRAAGRWATRWPSRISRIRSIRSRSEEHTSELQSLMRISYAVFCLTKKQLSTR